LFDECETETNPKDTTTKQGSIMKEEDEAIEDRSVMVLRSFLQSKVVL